MANVQIPNLPAVAALSGEELFEGVQAGTSVKISLGQVIAATRTGTPTTVPLPISAGGTGASTAPNARTNLGLGTISTQDASAVAITGGSITGITDLAVADGGTGASDAAGARTNLGLGTMSTQSANAVAITGGSINGTTIGASTPASISGTTGTFTGDLTVTNANPSLSFFETGVTADRDSRIRLNDNDLIFETVTDAGVQVRENMRITYAGNIGINKALPTVSLDVTGAGSFSGNLAVSGDLTVTNANPSLTFFETGITADRDARIRLNDNDLIFETVTDAGVQVRENMRIKYTGDIGIGTVSPTARLDIAVNSASDAVRINQTGAGNALVVEDSTSPDSTPFVVSATGSVGIGTTTPAVKLDVVGSAIISGDLTVDTNTLYVDSGNDRVGVGTITPGTKLDVVGTANATNMTRGGSQVYSRDNILATVSQSAGVPTGGIIERGSSANGEYVRYADGTMICVNYSAGNQSTSTAAGSIFRATNASTWTFPSTFAVAPVVSGMADDNLARWVSLGSPSTTSVTFRQMNFENDANTEITRLMAIGRWF